MARRQYGTGSIYQRSDGRWIGRIEAGWTATGTRRRITVSAPTERECRARLRARQREIAEHGRPAARPRSITVKAWADQWLTLHAREVRPASYTASRYAVARWVAPTIGAKRLDALTPGDVRAVLDAVRAAGLADATVTRVRAAMLGMLRRAVEEGHAVPEQVLTVKDRRPPDRRRRDRVALPDDAARAVLTAAARTPGGVRFAVALLQGLRPAEARGLTWDAADLDALTLTVDWQLQALPYLDKGDRSRGHRIPDQFEARHLTHAYHLVRPKTGAGRRVVPLLPVVADALAAWSTVAAPNPWGLIFTAPTRGGMMPVRDDLDRQQWRDLLTAAGVTEPYDLYEARHTMATLLLEAGVEEHVVTAIMGHTNVRTTRLYQHARIDHARSELERATAGLLAPVTA